MPPTIAKLPDEPIILVTEEPGSSLLEDITFNLAEVTRLIGGQPEPVFLVIDIRRSTLRLDEISSAANLVAGQRDSLLHHPNIRETIVVSTSIIVRLSLAIMTGPIFGALRLSLADTVEEALDRCRAEVEQAVA